jgi:hypothetical protein
MRIRLIHLYPFTALLLGMIVTQALATVQVYLSNTDLYDSLTAIKDAGYLTIPNQNVMGSLKRFGPAFCGGLFFTFSIGAGISFFTLASAWIWDRLFYRNKYLLFLFLLLWLGFLFALNFHGFKLFVTLYFLIIPPAVFAVTTRSLSHLNTQNRRRNEIIHIIPVLVLAFFLSWQMDSRMFADFRDIFLLSNPVGSKINNFYYKYTLYPAEVFKSIDQKMLKTCRIENTEKNTSTHTLEQVLISYDCIPIESNSDVDLKVASVDDDFIFANREKPILRISSKKFFANPDRAIKEFTEKSDAYPLFRRITFLSLLIGFPLAVYIIVQGSISFALSLFLRSGFKTSDQVQGQGAGRSRKRSIRGYVSIYRRPATQPLGLRWDFETTSRVRASSVIASALCFILCLIIIFSFHLNRSRDVSAENIATALKSDRWQNRVAALKIIKKENLEIKQFQAYPQLLTSPHITERYWLVRTLASSRNPSTYLDILSFLNDTHPNVLSMAFYALGKRGNKNAINKIIPIIETSNDWYSQWYAYRALRALGWKQTKLN